METLKKTWKTLRFRLALWNAMVVIVTALVILVGLRQGVRWTLLHEMDQILLEDAQEISIALRETSDADFPQLTEELQRKALGHFNHGWFVQLLDRQGQMIWSTNKPDIPIGSPMENHGPQSVGNYRIVRRNVTQAPTGITSILLGGTLSFLRTDMARIDRLMFLAAGVVVVIAPVSGYWLASRAAQTLGNIIQTAARLRPSHLAERLPIRGTGDELDQLSQTINSLLDRIAAYLDQKRDFLANAAHELRTPLAAIRSSVEVALNSDRSREEYEDLLVSIIDVGSSLETLVNQLLLLSESEAELIGIDVQVIDFKEVISKSVDMFRGVAESRDITLTATLHMAVSVRGNRNHLRHVVNNLIDNAVKYTPPGGKVEVSLTRTNDGFARFNVADTGIGIVADDLGKIFDRFFRSDRSRSRMSDTVGSGLGLSICHAVVTAHGGEIHCVSSPEQGTNMTVLLPIADAAEEQSLLP